MRRRNEDAVLLRQERLLYAVADGMGGHAAGNVASALAIASIDAAFPRTPSSRIGMPRITTRLKDAFADANEAIILRAGQRPSEAGMGTTLTAVFTMRLEPSIVIAHIGDSRAYRLRHTGTDAGFLQLTQDHTWVQQQVEAGALTADQARVHPWSSILTRVLGMEQPGEPDIIYATAMPGDTLLLCSDGLTAMLTDTAIAGILAQPAGLSDIAAQLIDAANAAGGRDNTTVVLLRASSETEGV
ncbi:MAG: protein phosphatase 2C domain-containing protein [Longimicrobiales bacterium]